MDLERQAAQTQGNDSIFYSQNQLFVFENGQIVQQGKHKDLIEIKGYYKKLSEKQQSDISK